MQNKTKLYNVPFGAKWELCVRTPLPKVDLTPPTLPRRKKKREAYPGLLEDVRFS